RPSSSRFPMRRRAWFVRHGWNAPAPDHVPAPIDSSPIHLDAPASAAVGEARPCNFRSFFASQGVGVMRCWEDMESQGSGAPGLHGIHVLVIEDSPGTLDMLTALLRLEGAVAVGGANVRDALAALRA